MPDIATIRDVARKIEQWRDTLDDDERETLTDWMAVRVGREQLDAGRRWWFDPDADGAHPRRTAADALARDPANLRRAASFSGSRRRC